MGSIHIFADTDLFRGQELIDPAQTEDDVFGPVNGSEKTEFRVTSRFRLDEGAMAYAAFDGIAMIQDVTGHEDRLVNLVLFNSTPSSGQPIPRVMVYRGLRREDFLVGAGVNATLQVKRNGTDANGLPLTSDLLRNIHDHFDEWRTYVQGKGISVTMTSPTYDLLGYMDYDAGATPKRKPHTATADVYRLFYRQGRIENFVPFAIKKGWSLGRFDFYAHDNQIRVGIDVIQEFGHASFTVADARVLERKIIVSAPGLVENEGAQPINKMAERERILDFIDPAAFYNLHKDLGVDYRDRVTNTTRTKSGDDVYTSFITKFYSHNRIYLDIRNQHDSSLNYYLDNMDQISEDQNFKIGVNLPPGSESADKYYQNYWPLYFTSVRKTTDGNNLVALKFRREYNPSVLVYHDIGSIKLDSFFRPNNFSYDLTISGDWTDRFVYDSPNIPTIGGASGDTSTCWWIRIYVIRKKLPENDLPRRLVPTDNYLDLAFGPVMPFDARDDVFWYIMGGKRYVDGSKITGLKADLMVQVGVFETPTTITFFAQVITEHRLFKGSVQKIAGGTSTAGTFVQSVDGWSNRANIFLGFATELAPGNSAIIPSLNGLGVRGTTFGLMSLQLTRQEYDTKIIPAAQQLTSAYHTTYLSLDAFGTIVDGTKSARRVSITVAGLNASGTYTRVNPVGGAVTVVTNDMLTFITEDAANAIVVRQEKSDPKAYFPANDGTSTNLIAFVEAVEKAYASEDSSDPRHTVTRLRHQYYGYASDAKQSFFSMKGAKTYAKSCVFGAVIPGPQNFLDNNTGTNTCFRKHRILTEPDDIDDPIARAKYERAFPYLWASADENFIGDNPSPFVQDPDTVNVQRRKTWDLGHALFGLESLLYGGAVAWPNCETPGCEYPGAIFWPYPLRCDVFSSIILATYIADLGPVPASFWMHGARGKSTGGDAWYPATPDLDREWEISASDPDLIGDAEAFGWFAAWKAVKAEKLAAGVPFKFSDVLKRYYDRNTTHVEHFTHRWKLFCEHEKFINGAGQWVIDDTTDRYDELIDQMAKFAIFWCNVIEHDYTTGILLAKGAFWGIRRDQYLDGGLTDTYTPIYTTTNRFLNKVHAWYDEERT